MLLNGNETTIRPVLALDFPELRALYEAYYVSGLSDEPKEHKEALLALLTFALKRTNVDPSPLLDTSNPNALDVDDVDEIVFAAGGSRGKVLMLIRDEMPKWWQVAFRATGPDSLSPSPPESEPQSGT
jgi:hypothetical protein